MGILECRCGAKGEGKTFEEADEAIDHGYARIKGTTCDGDPTKMTWNGKPVAIRPLIYLVGERAKKAEKPKTDSKDTNPKTSQKSKPNNPKKSKGKSKGQK